MADRGPSASVFATLRKLREDSLARVRKVNAMTEEGVTIACNHLKTVGDVAKQHITSLRDLLVGTTNSRLQEVIGAHANHVRQHAALLDAAVASHATEVFRLGELSSQIKAAAADIERANRAARVLSINARIESARSGAEVFKTIAVEMYELSRVIISANGRIQELASQLDTALPRLVEQSQHLRTLVAEFTSSARIQIDDIDREVASLQRNVDGSLASSDAALAQIIKCSYDGASALQFQDVARQSLLQIDKWQADALRAVASELHLEVDVPPSEEAISSEEQIGSHATAGDVMLF